MKDHFLKTFFHAVSQEIIVFRTNFIRILNYSSPLTLHSLLFLLLRKGLLNCQNELRKNLSLFDC